MDTTPAHALPPRGTPESRAALADLLIRVFSGETAARRPTQGRAYTRRRSASAPAHPRPAVAARRPQSRRVAPVLVARSRQ